MSIDEVTAQNEQGQPKARANAEDARANKDPNSRGAPNGNNTDPQPCDTGMDTELNDADVEEILATLETASEIKQTEAMLNAPNLLDKYTDAEMPPIFSDSPAGLLEGIEKQQARKWILNATGKVLARPFDSHVHYQPNHHDIAMDLISAACEITGSSEATVATLIKEKGDQGRHPITFLIHNLTQLEVHTLLSRPVWSSNVITFQVSPVITMRPDFLFTIQKFTTLSEHEVMKAIMEIWNDATTTTFFEGLVQSADEKDKITVTNGIIGFIKSMHVKLLDTKKEGGKRDPQYNIYANGQLIPNNNLWFEIKAFLKGRVYKSTECGKGNVKDTNHKCGLCHGCDHPRGLCPFPKIKGWNGGRNRVIQMSTQEKIRGGRDTGRANKRPYAAFEAGQQSGAGPSKPRRSFGPN